ncbi:helix-turn-helix transcriptional regulator [Clostridium boliviensis]|uniref:Helix-turn-helix transcriptional regulator n=1 Tax=Clostridium boliviensis TaxID=318465 RepID=A0ABU4GJF5_9CLOT|nr:helix-turn-helix transcriptional regulator [Clostridium boliviensis]MDW2797731.1 helix-turn-helix transcriptional regulator [Clostridium boliviensis]
MSITGQRIKERRNQLEMSADDVAAQLGVSRSTIFRYENGHIEKVPANVLEKLAGILKTTPAYLMGWQDDCFEHPSWDAPVWMHVNADAENACLFREDEGLGYHTDSLRAILENACQDDRYKITAMAKIYLTLTDSAKRKANDYIMDLYEQPKYRNQSQNASQGCEEEKD